MLLSVIVPTYRIGGLDVLCGSLNAQTHRDFELLLADALFEYRAPCIRAALAAQQFPVHHFPSGGPAISNYSQALNDAVVRASGEVIVILPDYAWLDPDCLATHARFHTERAGARTCLMLEYDLSGLPTLHPELDGYHPSRHSPGITFELHDPECRFEAAMTAEAERYESDVKSGKLDRFMWSIFAEAINAAEMVAALPQKHHHRLWDYIGPDNCPVHVEWGPNHCSLKNESFGIDLLEELGGFDEDLDGTHLFQDWSFTKRLTEAGWQWSRERGGMLRIVDPRPVLTCKRALRPMRSNEEIHLRKAAKMAPVNPGWSLRERRAERHGA